VHSHKHASNALLFHVSRRWSLLASHQPGIQQTLQDYGYGLVYHAVCLFTPPAFARYLFQPAQRAGSGWVGLGAWFLAEVVYPSKDGHPLGTVVSDNVLIKVTLSCQRHCRGTVQN